MRLPNSFGGASAASAAERGGAAVTSDTSQSEPAQHPAAEFHDPHDRNDFDLVAPIYDRLAALVYGGKIKHAQTALLPQLQGVNNALVLGGGTGWFLHELLAQTPVRRVLYVEKSRPMLDRSRRLIARTNPEWLERVEFLHGTDESVTAAHGPFDLLVTNFFLDLFSEANCADMIERLYPHLKAGGRWLFVDFHLPDGGWRRAAAWALFRVMYTFFVVTSKIESRMPPDYGRTFDRLGLVKTIEQPFYATMIRAQLLTRPAPAAPATGARVQPPAGLA